MLLDVGGWCVSECSGRPIFILFIKENWICTVTRYHVEPNINILLTRDLPFDLEVRQWSHSLMTSLPYLWAMSNNRTRGHFKYDTTWFCFRFDFACSHARWKEVKRKTRQRKESQTRLMSWYWKRKLTWGKELVTYNGHSWIMFGFNWLVITWRGEEGFVWNWTSTVKGEEEFWT